MTIRRAPKQDRFTVVDNVVFNSGLSFRAMGLLTYLLSKPDHWEVSVAQLVKLVKNSAKADGRDAVYAILRELIDKGFIERIQARDDKGRTAGTEYVVHDTPQTVAPVSPDPVTPKPETEKPQTDKPSAAEPTQVNTEGLVKTETSVNTDNPASPDGEPVAQEGEPESGPPADPDVTLPDWLPVQPWQDFVEHRKQAKASLTAKAKTMLLAKLERLRRAGHDPAELLETSIVNGWKGVFPPDKRASRPQRTQYHGLDQWSGEGLQTNGQGRKTL